MTTIIKDKVNVKKMFEQKAVHHIYEIEYGSSRYMVMDVRFNKDRIADRKILATDGEWTIEGVTTPFPTREIKRNEDIYKIIEKALDEKLNSDTI